MKTYLLIFSDTVGTSQLVSSYLSQILSIKHWRYDIQHAIFFKTELSANNIYKLLKEKIPTGRFFISEVSDNRQGYMTKQTWTFLKQ